MKYAVVLKPMPYVSYQEGVQLSSVNKRDAILQLLPQGGQWLLLLATRKFIFVIASYLAE
jgi:hypothetical protein